MSIFLVALIVSSLPFMAISFIPIINEPTKIDNLEEIETFSFNGTIIEVNQNGNLIIEPNENETIRNSSDQISVQSKVDRIWEVGTKVKIIYIGGIIETYPAQVNAIDIQEYHD